MIEKQDEKAAQFTRRGERALLSGIPNLKTGLNLIGLVTWRDGLHRVRPRGGGRGRAVRVPG
jgi:hypothetical protein